MSQGAYKDKARGMLVGLAVGDALGAPYEFGWRSRQIEELGDKISHYSESMVLPKGAWTDDTSMALCLADSLIENKGYNSYDVMRKYFNWVNYGYRSFDGAPAFDVGIQTANSIGAFIANPVIPADEPRTTSAGNGAIMRLAPVVIANVFPEKIQEAHIEDKELNIVVEMAELSCRETHNSYVAQCTTGVFARLLYDAVRGETKNNIRRWAIDWTRYTNKLYDESWLKSLNHLIERVNDDGDNLKDLGGYIIDAYTIAIWGFIHSDSFKDGMLKVIRLGGDTDTNAAIYGQLAGAYYGYEKIPKNWRDGICQANDIVNVADHLLELDECPIIKSRFRDDKHFAEPSKGEETNRPSDSYRKKTIEREQNYEPADDIKSIGDIIKDYMSSKKKDGHGEVS